jgi:GT2 family glycosyltransferase
LDSVVADLATLHLGPATPSPDIWVVDNASTDGTVEALQTQFQLVNVVKNVENVGFCEANNQALRRCAGDTALLLNPDTVLQQGCVCALLRRMQSCEQAGVVGPMLLNEDRSVQSSRRRFPTLRTGLFESTIVQRMAPTSPSLRRYYVSDRADDEAQEVDWVTGACFLVRRAAWEHVGLLDPRYFMYSEELDWQRRLQRAGWRVIFEPAARVMHLGGKSSDQDVLARHVRFHASKYRYFSLYGRAGAALLLRWSILLMYIVQMLEECGKLALRHRPSLRLRRLALFAEVIAWHVGIHR